jgi:hypothetical protein
MVTLKISGHGSSSVGTDVMIPRYAYNKSFKVQLPSKHEWQNGFYPNNK